MGGIRAVSIAASSTRATLSVIGKTRIAQESDRSSVLTRYRWSSALQFAVTGMIERGHAGSTLAGLGKDRQVGVGRVAKMAVGLSPRLPNRSGWRGLLPRAREHR